MPKILCAEKSPSLQKQKKSSIFRTVICQISGEAREIKTSNRLSYKWVREVCAGFVKTLGKWRERKFLLKTHKNTTNNF